MLAAGHSVRILLAVVASATVALVVLLVRPLPMAERVVVPQEVRTVTAASAAPRPVGFQGSLSCAAAACHGATLGNEAVQTHDQYVARAYSRWAELDPHAGAYRTLHSNLSQQIVEGLTGAASGTPAYGEALRSHCFGCHAPLAAESTTSTTSASETELPAADLMSEGVSCEACHGAAEKWLLSHAAGGTEASSGMQLTEPLAHRARACVACHVGTGKPGQEVNHDLIAAGHPRLQFEFRAYHEALPKHWQPTIHDTNAAEAWNVGQLASANAAVYQFVYRKEHGAIWPEFSEMDCYSCHRALTMDTGDDIASPGVPPLQQWYLLAPENWPMPLADYIPIMNQSLTDPTLPLGLTLEDIIDRVIIQSAPNSASAPLPLVEQLKQVEQRAAEGRPSWEVHAVLWLLASTMEAEARHQLAQPSNVAATGPLLASLKTERAKLAELLPTARKALTPPAQFQAGPVQRELVDQAKVVGQILVELGETP